MNVLKSIENKHRTFYNKLSREFRFQEVWNTLMDKVSEAVNLGKEIEWEISWFNLKISENGVQINPVKSVRFLKAFTELGSKVDNETRDFLLEVTKPKTFVMLNKKNLMVHIHRDLIVCLSYLADAETTPSLKKFLEDYVQDNYGISHKDLRQQVFRVSNIGARSTLHTFNRHSIIWDKAGVLSRGCDKLPKGTLQILEKTNLINLFEFPEKFDAVKIDLFMTELFNVLEKVEKKYPLLKKNPVSIKLRKIRRTYKTGMYIPVTNTIILDPRDTSSLLHEIGHWVHTYEFPSLVTIKECEEFAKNFDPS